MIAGVSVENERDPNQTDILIRLADHIELFHTADRVAYADIVVGSHKETLECAIGRICSLARSTVLSGDAESLEPRNAPLVSCKLRSKGSFRRR